MIRAVKRYLTAKNHPLSKETFNCTRRMGNMMINIFSIFGLLHLMPYLGHGFPATGSESPDSFEKPFSIIDEIRGPQSRGDDGVIAVAIAGGNQNEGIVKRGNSLENVTSEGEIIATGTLPATISVIHETSAKDGVSKQSQSRVDQTHVAPTQQSPVEKGKFPIGEIVEYPHVGSGFPPVQVGPILEGINPPEPVLLPLITEPTQTLNVLPVSQTYYQGQFVNPVVVPPETGFGQIVIKAIEPIERTISLEQMSQVRPLFTPEPHQVYLIPESSSFNTHIESTASSGIKQKSSDVEDSTVLQPVVDESQKTVGQETIESNQPSRDDLGSPIGEKNLIHGPGDLYQKVEFIGEDGQTLEHTHFSIKESTGDDLDKICLILKKE